MTLDPADIERIAQRMAELIAATQTQPLARFVDAAQLAELLVWSAIRSTPVPTHSELSGSDGRAAVCSSIFSASGKPGQSREADEPRRAPRRPRGKRARAQRREQG
jgi:hypothetical protein